MPFDIQNVNTPTPEHPDASSITTLTTSHFPSSPDPSSQYSVDDFPSVLVNMKPDVKEDYFAERPIVGDQFQLQAFLHPHIDDPKVHLQCHYFLPHLVQPKKKD